MALGVAVVTAIVLAGCSGADPDPAATVTVTPGVGASDADATPGTTPPASTEATPGGPERIGSGLTDTQILTHADRRYAVVTLPLDTWDVRIDWDPDAGGEMLADVVAADPTIALATNAGIFTPSLRPGGLLVSDGEELVALNLADGGGNFHLLPNAVFAVLDDGTATVVDSTAYEPAGVVHATQSGPALVLDGEIHPAFNEGSTNLALRSGVGVSPDGTTVYLAMSTALTNFWDFATLFRDELGVDDALYLDGQVSDLWVDGLSEPSLLSGPYAGVITARQR